jgi:hypothetical protein
MDTASLRSASRVESLVCCGVAVLAAAMAMFSWTKTGQVSDLLNAIAGIAIAPVWYIRPLSFTIPIRQALKPRPEPVPQWAVILTTVFVTLLWASLLVRWVS